MGKWRSNNLFNLQRLKTDLLAVLRHKFSLQIVCASLFFSILCCVALGYLIADQSKRQFKLSHEKIVGVFQQEINKYQVFLKLAEARVKDASITPIVWKETFSLLDDSSNESVISSLWYSQVVPLNEKESFEEFLRRFHTDQKEYESFQVRSNRNTDSFITVKFVAPIEHNKSWLGYDLSSNEHLRRSLESTKSDISSIRDPHLTGTTEGILISKPVLAVDETNQEREDFKVVGYIHAVLNTQNLIQNIIANSHIDPELGVEVTENISDKHDQIIYSSLITAATIGVKQRFVEDLFSFGDIKWRTVISGSAIYGLSIYYIYLFAALLLSAVIFNVALIVTLSIFVAKTSKLEHRVGYLGLKIKGREEQLRTIIDSVPIGMAIISPQGNCLYQNSVFLDLTGCLVEYFEKHAWYECVTDKDKNKAKELWNKVSQQKISFEEQFEFQGSRESAIEVLCKGTPISSANELRGFICSFVDRTSHSELEKNSEKLQNQVALLESEIQRVQTRYERSEQLLRTHQEALLEKQKLAQQAKELEIKAKQDEETVDNDEESQEIEQAFPEFVNNFITGLKYLAFGKPSKTKSRKKNQNSKLNHSTASSLQYDYKPNNRALLVESNEADSVKMMQLLHALGTEVVIASSEKMAVQAAMSEKFNIVLIDLNMSQSETGSIAKTLRKSGITVPIIALASTPDGTPISDIVGAGYHTCLAKNLDSEDLSRRLKLWMNT
jgi:PAS domain S-box-containing protein